MENSNPKILVLGATGQVGGSVLRLLSADLNVQTIAAARSPDKARHLGASVRHLDLDRVESIAPALEGIERVFMATGYTVDMLRQSKDFLNAARRAGVRHIVHLGACGDDDTRVAHYGWHQFIERYIEWSGFSFTHLRPEIFMQNLLGYGGESYVKEGVIRHYVGSARLSWVDCEDVAAVAAACLLEPGKHAGQTYRLGYEARTYDSFPSSILRDVSTCLGRCLRHPSKWRPLSRPSPPSSPVRAGNERGRCSAGCCSLRLTASSPPRCGCSVCRRQAFPKLPPGSEPGALVRPPGRGILLRLLVRRSCLLGRSDRAG